MTEHLNNFQWWPVQDHFHRQKPESRNPILPSSGAPTSAEWHSENEAAQAKTAALAATGEVEDVPVAGVSTAREGETHPYFAWVPVAEEERPVVDKKSSYNSSSDLSEYMERFRQYTADESVSLQLFSFS